MQTAAKKTKPVSFWMPRQYDFKLWGCMKFCFSAHGPEEHWKPVLVRDDNVETRQRMEIRRQAESKRDEKRREKLMAFVPISFSPCL